LHNFHEANGHIRKQFKQCVMQAVTVYSIWQLHSRNSVVLVLWWDSVLVFIWCCSDWF